MQVIDPRLAYCRTVCEGDMCREVLRGIAVKVFDEQGLRHGHKLRGGGKIEGRGGCGAICGVNGQDDVEIAVRIAVTCDVVTFCELVRDL